MDPRRMLDDPDQDDTKGIARSRPGPWICTAVTIFALHPSVALAAETAALATPAAIVASFERFHRDSPNARGGERLLSELLCIRCHAPPENAAWPRDREGPRLHLAAQRWTIAALAERIADPAAFKPGTTMPAMLGHLDQDARTKTALDIAHFLRSQVDADAELTATDRPAAVRGAELYHQIGCVACHAPRLSATTGAPPFGSVPLPRFAGKASMSGIAQFLRDPQVDRPGGRMPSLKLSQQESTDLAQFLLEGTDVPGPLSYWRYARSLRDGALEDRDPIETGVAQRFDPVIGRDHRYVLRFEGWFDVDEEEDVTFEVAADDGVRLWIDGNMVGEQRDREGDDPAVIRRSGTLAAGIHRLRVDSGHRRDHAELRVSWQRGTADMTPVPMKALRHADAVTYNPTIEFDPTRAARGEEAFQTFGCASCHAGMTRSPAAARPLSALNSAGGCLSGSAAPGRPIFALDDAERVALRAALEETGRAARGEAVPLPGAEDSLLADLETWNCLACHARGGRGGVPADRDAWFLSKGDDLGEEGRVPPDLTGVGNKLREEWLHQVVTEGATARRYFFTRMPRFGDATAGITTRLRDIDRRGTRLASVATPREERIEVGHDLVGTAGFGCITCHDFNQRDALTMGLADLITAPERLNEDWFHAFLNDPAAYRPETRMPAFFERGRSTRRDLLGGDAHAQISAIWAFLSQGVDARDPEGINQKGRELVVGGDPIIYRGKLWEAGWRGIAVGFPARRHLAFDAEQLRWSILWKGRFLDASAHWNVQGMGRVRPLAYGVWVLPQGPGIARLDNPAAAWPEPPTEPGAERRFLGYDLDQAGQPTFRYEIAGIRVEDTPRPGTAADGTETMRRSLRLLATADTALESRYLLLAREARITRVVKATVRIDGVHQIQVIGATAPPFLVDAGSKVEARLPLRFGADHTATLELEYRW